MTLSAGTRLGPYEILAPLGAGGMGEVYRARDERLKREVAIKVLPASLSADPDRLRRFEQEAQAAGLLNHPNITAVYDTGSHEGAPYVVQELLEGETLRSELAGGRFAPRKAIDYAVQMAQGLAAAHDKGIVHRDLKPENLFVTNDGRVKILDFGLAKLTQPEGGGNSDTNLPTETRGTEPGVVMGTLGYMSPEQVKGRVADARSDIFALGSILYEMLSGQRAFRGDSAAETISAILREDPPDLSVTNQKVSPGLERIVRHCLEKSPERRFQSAGDIAFDLEAISGLPTTSGAARVTEASLSRRSRARLAVAGSAVAARRSASAGSGSPAAGSKLFRPSNASPTGAVSSATPALPRTARRSSTAPTGTGTPSRIFSTRPGGSRIHRAALAERDASVRFVARRSGDPSRSEDRLQPLHPARDAGGRAAFGRISPRGPARRAIRRLGARGKGPRGGPTGRCTSAAGVPTRPTGVREFGLDSVAARVSRGGRILFYEGLPYNGYVLSVIDSQNRKTVLGPRWPDGRSSPWSPDGDEVWLPATNEEAASTPLIAFDLSGRQRMFDRAPFTADLHDVSRDGRALLTLLDQEEWAQGLLSGQKSESRVVSRTDLRVVDISDDGKLLVLRDAFVQEAENVWIARGDDSPPVRLGEGVAHGLSGDGRGCSRASTARSWRFRRRPERRER